MDIQRYGQAQLGGAYHYVQQQEMNGAVRVLLIHVDGVGQDTEVRAVPVGQEGWTAEDAAALPSVGEAIHEHMRPAREEAERNMQSWLKSREDAPPAPVPERLDPATARFMDDGPGLDVEGLSWRP